MKLIKMLPATMLVLSLSSVALADSVMVTTSVPCSLPATSGIPDYNAKVASLRSGADQNIAALNAMTPDARVTADGQGMMQQAQAMYSEAEACQIIADNMSLQMSGISATNMAPAATSTTTTTTTTVTPATGMSPTVTPPTDSTSPSIAPFTE